MSRSRLSAIDISDDQVLKKFEDLTEIVEGKRAKADMKSAMRSTLSILRTAVRKGARPAVGHYRKLATKGVQLKVWKSGLGGRVQITQADYYPEYGPGKTGHGKLLGLFWWELGTKTGIGRDGRMHRGTAPKHFFKASVESRVNEASDVLTRSIDKIIQREAKKR